jgi:hypothetical protein
MQQQRKRTSVSIQQPSARPDTIILVSSRQDADEKVMKNNNLRIFCSIGGSRSLAVASCADMAQWWLENGPLPTMNWCEMHRPAQAVRFFMDLDHEDVLGLLKRRHTEGIEPSEQNVDKEHRWLAAYIRSETARWLHARFGGGSSSLIEPEDVAIQFASGWSRKHCASASATCGESGVSPVRCRGHRFFKWSCHVHAPLCFDSIAAQQRFHRAELDAGRHPFTLDMDVYDGRRSLRAPLQSKSGDHRPLIPYGSDGRPIERLDVELLRRHMVTDVSGCHRVQE